MGTAYYVRHKEPRSHSSVGRHKTCTHQQNIGQAHLLDNTSAIIILMAALMGRFPSYLNRQLLILCSHDTSTLTSRVSLHCTSTSLFVELPMQVITLCKSIQSCDMHDVHKKYYDMI